MKKVQIKINEKAMQRAQKYFEKQSEYLQLIQFYPLKDEVVAEFIDKDDNVIKYVTFSEQTGKGNSFWRSLDEAILANILNLGLNDDKLLNVLMAMQK